MGSGVNVDHALPTELYNVQFDAKAGDDVMPPHTSTSPLTKSVMP